ncbi:ComEA family DNA-binding protein [Daejeonella oryzae]|uniref:ComEA family DNA-binding protein n=1 Tax=Daejeonella oryzae TaxID=1122943 RepID=UPI00041E364E|nr:helix-hairpin-helix domain-containing protein [Daejeonella oryzae]
MKNALKAYFSFSKKEYNGILVLCILMVLVLAFPYIYSYFKVPVVYDTESFQREISAFKSSAQKRSYSNYNNLKEYIEDNELRANYFLFDPNGLSASDWRKLGLSERQIKVIKNYESKGGRFYRNEDLKKIYSISESQYSKLEPYISIKKSFTNSKPIYSQTKEWENKKPVYEKNMPFEIVELNSADSAKLETIRGIGPAFALRILKYRQRLGGFHSKEQLREIYGLDSAMFENLKNQVKVDANSIQKTNVNKAQFDDLKRNPYLSYKQINAIIQYRKQHGPYQAVSDLKKIAIMNDEILRKIEPYLLFE